MMSGILLMLSLFANNLAWNMKVLHTLKCSVIFLQLPLFSDETPKGCPARGLNVTGSFLMNDVMCLGTEDSLLTCAHSYDVADCIDEEAVVVECKGLFAQQYYYNIA